MKKLLILAVVLSGLLYALPVSAGRGVEGRPFPSKPGVGNQPWTAGEAATAAYPLGRGAWSNHLAAPVGAAIFRSDPSDSMLRVAARAGRGRG